VTKRKRPQKRPTSKAARAWTEVHQHETAAEAAQLRRKLAEDQAIRQFQDERAARRAARNTEAPSRAHATTYAAHMTDTPTPVDPTQPQPEPQPDDDGTETSEA
jgi:hypothetical protein